MYLMIPIINEWKDELSHLKSLELTKDKKLSVLETTKEQIY